MILAALLVSCASLTAVDGDTVKCDGVRMRDMGDGAPYVSGYDTPAIRGPGCDAERQLGLRAKARMEELIAMPGVTVEDSGARDRYGRPLVSIRMKDGRSIGSILLAEGLARPWTPDYVPAWCTR